jgi:hypothetical protein
VERLEELFSFRAPLLNERQRHLMAGALANTLGRGGPTVVARASAMSRNAQPHSDPDLVAAVDDLVGPDLRGDPMSPLRWTVKSTGQLGRCPRFRGLTRSPSARSAISSASWATPSSPRPRRSRVSHPQPSALGPRSARRSHGANCRDGLSPPPDSSRSACS